MHPNLTAETQRGNDLLEEAHATQQRLDEIDGQVGPPNGQRQPGQPCSGADIHDSCILANQLGDDRAVEQMTRPNPTGFPGADQATLDAGIAQQLGKVPGQLDAGTEYGSRSSRFTLPLRYLGAVLRVALGGHHG